LLIPLSGLWLINSLIAYPIAVQIANNAYDRELLNSADSVVARVRVRDGRIGVDLPPAAQAILRYNNNANFFYQVFTESQNLAGDKIPLPPELPEVGNPTFRYDTLKGQRVRVVAVRVQDPVDSPETITVQVAESLSSREFLEQKILATVLMPQVALVFLGVLAVWIGVSKGLKPLGALESAISSRSRSDLSAIDEQMAPLEVRPIVGALNELLDRLREDIESQKRFVANAAHQLRTPLAGLKTYVTLSRRITKDARVAELMEQVDRGVDRMSHLVNRLLSLAKAEPRSTSPQLRPVELNEIASAATEQLVGEAIDKRVELAFEPSASDCRVSGDAESLRELVQNLVENAVRYTPSGGEVIVSVVAEPKPAVVVEDTGPGIPAVERDKVFERFYRGDTEEPGSGLGLAIVREIAAHHGAIVTIVDNDRQQGTRITVEFGNA
jgi:two-component system, OmpR family, sensor histidine kinase TctE